MFKLISKILLCLIIFLVLTVSGIAAIYVKVLPNIIENEHVINYIEKIAGKYAGVDLDIQNPKLTARPAPDIDFSLSKLVMKKDNQTLLDLENIDLSLSFRNILSKRIIVNRLGADKIFADINKITAAFEKQEREQEHKSDWDIDLFNSVLYINRSFIIYNPDDNTKIELKADNIKLDNTQKEEKYLHFDFNADISKNDAAVHISFKDDNKIVMKNGRIYINGCTLTTDKSQMMFDAVFNKDKTFEIEIYAKRFFIPDLIRFLQTDIAENNINDVLLYLKNINGDFDFRVKITEKAFSGIINVNRCSALLSSLSDMPLFINSGDIIIKEKDIYLKNFKGYYDKKETNKITFDGTIKDYLKTAETDIDMKAFLTNDFTDKYLSKTAGVNLSLKGNSNAIIHVHTRGSDIDVSMAGKIGKGYDILVEGASLSPVMFDRALKADIHIKGDNVYIEQIKYFITKELTRESKGKVKPILTFDGNIRISDGKILDFGFNIPSPLPSEFLNVLAGQKLFKGGKFSGSLKMLNRHEYPKIKGNIYMDEIRIPSQRLFLRHGEITTDREELHLEAEGKYRRCNYTFSGNLLNGIKFPITVTSANLTVDEIDAEKVMKSFAAPVKPVEKIGNIYEEENDDDSEAEVEPFNFDFDDIIVENAVLKILKGGYKEMKFADAEAAMSLKNSIFQMQSNKFEIAEGHSSARINCDLKNQKYSIRLGIKDVNSDIISSALLNLPKEISGKASGLIELNTDETLKLNGRIKFAIKDGAIQKIGLVEYVLKFAALFRNPFVMISPSVLADLVSIPDGNFDKITGELNLKDNKVEFMKIKSYSPYLSAYIAGCYNIENSDASLRIYTKFSNKNKGIAGFLRYLSLNSLAGRIPLNSRNGSNYYAAELAQLPDIDADEKDCQIFLTKAEGDIEHNNFISSLKKIK